MLAEAQRSALQSVLSKLDTLEARLPVPSSPPAGNAGAVRAARRLNSAAGSLAASVLLDSAIEHWRGAFRNPAMYTPLAVSALTLLGSAHGMSDRRGSSHRARDWVYAAAALTGVAGTGFHLYNVLKRPGRLVWQNLFYGAPLGAPDVFRPGGWVPMREHRDTDEVDFVIVGTGAGGGTLACKLSEYGFSVVAMDAGPYFRPLEDFASDESEQTKLYWTDDRISDGENPVQLGSNNSGKAVGGSTVHFAMVSLRFRPEWFKSRSQLGYGFDWLLDWREMWDYYTEVEQALKISGPVTYPWGPRRPRYPYRAHEMNAAALALAQGCDAMGISWTETPLATVSAPRGKAPPCVYRGFCTLGCSTNAKQSALVTWIPRAIAAGAEIRDLAMVGRVEVGTNGLVTGMHYHREGQWRFQRARNVVVAGYAIETPRLLNSATDRFPQGLANSSGLVGKYVTVQANQAVWGVMDREVRSYKGPPSLAITEHWNYDDDKDFPGGYCYMSQGPLPQLWASTQFSAHHLWGDKLMSEMERYNHTVGLKVVGEMLPQERNAVTLAEDKDQYGLPIARLTYAWCDDDRRLINHSLDFMGQALQAVDARDIWRQEDDTCHLNGGARMGDDPRSSVVDADCRSWDIRNLWVCDGSVFPTVGGVNPSLTIQAIACRTGDRIRQMARRGEL